VVGGDEVGVVDEVEGVVEVVEAEVAGEVGE